jgi:hypothetical protein
MPNTQPSPSTKGFVIKRIKISSVELYPISAGSDGFDIIRVKVGEAGAPQLQGSKFDFAEHDIPRGEIDPKVKVEPGMDGVNLRPGDFIQYFGRLTDDRRHEEVGSYVTFLRVSTDGKEHELGKGNALAINGPIFRASDEATRPIFYQQYGDPDRFPYKR